MIASAVLGGASSLWSAYTKKKNAQSELEYQMEQNEYQIKQNAANQASTTNEFYSQKNQATQNVTQQMEQTYLSQLAQEEEYMGMKQQGAEAEGSLSARTAASGIEQGTTLQDVTRGQIADTLSTKREQIDKSLGSAIMGVESVRQGFSAGSSYMNLYQGQIQGLQNQRASLENQQSYLEDQYDAYDSGEYWLSSAFDVLGTGLNFWSSGESNNWWKKTKSSSTLDTLNLNSGGR